jgi:hypothetical protein
VDGARFRNAFNGLLIAAKGAQSSAILNPLTIAEPPAKLFSTKMLLQH